jgi:hypothetical protein
MPINIDASKQPQTSYEAGETQGSSAAPASKSLPELPKSLPELPSDLASQPSSVLSGLASEFGSPPTGSSAAPPSAATTRAQRRMGMVGDSVPEGDRKTLRDAKPSRSDAGGADPQVSVGQRSSQNAAASDFLQHDPYGKAGPSGARLSSTSLKSTRSSSSTSSKTSLNSMRSTLSNAGSRLQSGVRSALGGKTKSLEDLKKQGEGIRVQQEVQVDNTASEADMNQLAEQNQKIAQRKFGRTM